MIEIYPLTRIDFKIPMDIWGRKPIDYSNLKVLKALSFVHNKQDQLDTKDVKCLFISNLEGVKGYKTWKVKPRRSKLFIRRYVIFGETHMRMNCKKTWDERVKNYDGEDIVWKGGLC